MTFWHLALAVYVVVLIVAMIWNWMHQDWIYGESLRDVANPRFWLVASAIFWPIHILLASLIVGGILLFAVLRMLFPAPPSRTTKERKEA